MSDLSALLEGKLSPTAFVVKVAGEINKDLAWLGPFKSEAITFAVDGLAFIIERTGRVSPSFVEAIKGQLLNILSPPATPSQPGT
jgi:hypothetical protein